MPLKNVLKARPSGSLGFLSIIEPTRESEKRNVNRGGAPHRTRFQYVQRRTEKYSDLS